MPMINIKYDSDKVKDEEIVLLSKAVQKIVQDTTKTPEVFVYADSPKIRIDVAPIEIFVEMSASKVTDRDQLFQEIKTKLSEWKKECDFSNPITITLTPVVWSFEVNI